MEKAVEQYCRNIEQFILNNADSKKNSKHSNIS